MRIVSLMAIRGIWVGNLFMHGHGIGPGWTGWNDEDEEIILEGPDDWRYHEVWDEIVANAEWTDNATGHKYRLYQDDDLWMIRADVELCDDCTKQIG